MNTVKVRDIEIGAGAPKIMRTYRRCYKRRYYRQKQKHLIPFRLMLLNGAWTGLKHVFDFDTSRRGFKRAS